MFMFVLTGDTKYMMTSFYVLLIKYINASYIYYDNNDYRVLNSSEGSRAQKSCSEPVLRNLEEMTNFLVVNFGCR